MTGSLRIVNVMDESVATKLVELNRAFYDRFASDFAASRATPQPGFQQLLQWFPHEGQSRLLDVGCGNGRLVHFLREAGCLISYTGVDFSESLLDHAEVGPEDQLIVRDLTATESLEDLGHYDTVACLSTLQHIPGYGNRLSLMRQMAERLATGGSLIVGNWQFARSERQRRKIRPWADVGLGPDDVEPDDYLLTWQRGGYGLRYVAFIDEEAIDAMADGSGLSLVDQFRADGREGDLNLYTVLRKL